MREKLITPFIVLFALLVTSIINIFCRVDILDSMIRLLIVFIIFYIIGKISEKIIIKAINKDILTKAKNQMEEDFMVSMVEDEMVSMNEDEVVDTEEE